MHLWQLSAWEKYYLNESVRRGFRIRYDSYIDVEVKECIAKFCSWIREEFYFPIRVVMYVKGTQYIVARDGEKVSATFLAPYDHFQEPHIRLSVGDYEKLLLKRGKNNALLSILNSIAHELSHYFQWINDVNLTDIGIERQASVYAYGIVTEYIEFIEEMGITL